MQNPLADELDAVHQELKKADAADPDLLEILSRVVHDVTTLKHEEAAASARRASGQRPSERLEEKALLFEAEHPKLAGALRRLVKALADLGI